MSFAQQKQVSVAGAAAYIGGPLLRQLKQAGYRTVALVRPSTDTSAIVGHADALMAGDLGDFQFVEAATRGSWAIINLVNQLNPSRTNLVAQLENDVPPAEACLFAGLKHDARVVHTSGNFALPTRGRSGMIDERLTPAPSPAIDNGAFLPHWPTFNHIDELAGVCLLAEAKHRCEHLVHSFVQLHPRSRACTVIPAATYGPGLGGRVSFWDNVPAWYLAGQFQDFMTGFIHVEDLCRCYLAVIERGRSGGRYLAAGQPLRVSDYVRLYAAAASVDVAALSQRGVFENPQGIVYDDSATRRELGVEWERDLRASLAEHMAYLRQHGKLNLPAAPLLPG